MAHQGVTEGAFLAFLDPYVPLLVGLLVVALVLFTRWLETGDRSAYAVGAAAAVLAPVWVIGMLVVQFGLHARDPLPSGTDDLSIPLWLVTWAYWLAGLAALLAVLWFTLRPMWTTGLFLMAPQGEVRRRFKTLESSWQFAIGSLVAVKGLVLVFAFLERWL